MSDPEMQNFWLLCRLCIFQDHPCVHRSDTDSFQVQLACVFPDGRQFTVRGECHGHIAFEESGTCGFGYDPLFISEKGCFGHLSAEEKDSISHRGKALELFKKELSKYI